jgi:hypothetical protein
LGNTIFKQLLQTQTRDRVQQQALLEQLKAQNALKNQSKVYNQYQDIAAGKGPNPAQTMLNQSTGQNVSNQAALMAGQRGAGANIGLMARQAAQSGANIQQQAAGQAATMQANQSLNALGQAGNMANTMAANRVGQVNSNLQGSQNQQNILQGANSAFNQTQGQLANTQLQGQQALIGGMMNSASSMMGAKGGEVQKFDDGGVVDPMAPPVTQTNPAFSPQSMFAQNLMPVNEPAPMQYAQSNPGADELSGKNKKGGGGGGGMGKMAMLALAAEGGDVGSELKKGGHVPGKAAVKGNSYENDTVKALLSPGEVVIPKSVMESKDPVRGAAEFVRSVMAKKGKMA